MTRLDNSVPVVVIAPGSRGHAVSIARSLGRLGVPVYGVHADKHSPTAQSRYWRKNFIWNIEKASPEAFARLVNAAPPADWIASDYSSHGRADRHFSSRP